MFIYYCCLFCQLSLDAQPDLCSLVTVSPNIGRLRQVVTVHGGFRLIGFDELQNVGQHVLETEQENTILQAHHGDTEVFYDPTRQRLSRWLQITN